MMQQQQQHAPPSDANAKTELWLGDLAPWMDETYIQTLFPSTDVAAAKLMRNKQTGQSEQYAFLTCTSQDAAQRILDTYNGVVMPGTTDQVFRLNWAAYGVGRTTNLIEFSLFVGDVAPDVTDYTLQETFRQYFPSVRSAKVGFGRVPTGWWWVEHERGSHALTPWTMTHNPPHTTLLKPSPTPTGNDRSTDWKVTWIWVCALWRRGRA